MDLTTLANAKQWLGISSYTDDDLLMRLITAASFFIETYLSRRLGSQDYLEIRNGTGGQVMNFREYPVTAVAWVAVNGVSLPPAPDTVTPGYRFTRTQIIEAALKEYGCSFEVIMIPQVTVVLRPKP